MIAFVHASWRLATRTVARTLDVFAQLRETMAEVRKNRRKLEAELFRTRYHISSKNDDDLPVVH